MKYRLLSRGHVIRSVIGSALSNGRGSITHGPTPARCGCFKEQRSHNSTFPTRSHEENPARPKSSSTAIQGSKSESTGLGLPALIENEVLRKARTILQSSMIPDTSAVEGTLQACEKFAQLLAEEAQSIDQGSEVERTPASKLLSLEESQHDMKNQDRKAVALTENAKSAATHLISSTAYKIITDPKVYITPKLLLMYVNVQSLLRRPKSLPEIFNLYASKPVPKSTTSPIKYSTPNRNKPSAHIPLQIANAALTAAMQSKDLSLCFDVINYSVCAPAFRLSKFFRKAFLPISGAVLAPFAIYRLASELSAYQNTVDTKMATQVLFAGIMAYVGFTATLGVVAVTTANDHMDRVVWATGTPLRERWMREEERMLIDRVAGAWGFQQRSRRGEEESPDWEALREWIGMRGMVLDKTELMDGME
ncbi:MAG: hypothetical protein LQ343_002134 [Gyalolechia ehrenbergii]|nr:MAG: hypothetical protein LQ343_002134 [Gyalolechia ehrenbergii]